MAEYASAIAGLIGFGLQLAGTIHQYASSVKNAKKVIGKLQDEINSLNEVIKDLDAFVRDHKEVINPDSSLMLATSGCQAWLEDFQQQIPPISSKNVLRRVFHRLKWPFDELDTRQAAESLHRFSQTFHFALTIQGFELLLKSNAEAVEEIQSLIDQRVTILDQNQVDISLQLNEIAGFLGNIPEMMIDLSDIKCKLQFVGDAVSNMTTNEEFSRFLAWIPSLEYQDRHQQLQKDRLTNSVQWFIKSRTFKEFVNGNAKPILWCPGAPGSGKTFLASIIIDNLFCWARCSSGHVAYLYFNYRHQAEQTPVRVLNCLLRQVIASYGRVPKGASALLQPFKCSQSLPPWDEMVRVFARMCGEDRGRIFIVLDALDECASESNRKSILELIRKLSAKGARICITSREFAADINEELANEVQIRVMAAEEDVMRILQLKMKERRITRKIDKTLREDIIKTILWKSQGMFLLPSLMIDTVLDQTTEKEIKTALRTLPTTLVEFYDLTLRVRLGNPGSKKAKVAMATLLWVSHAHRPLKLKELQHAVGSIAGTNRRRDLQLVLDDELFVWSCLGLVTLDSKTGTLRFVHQSVNEYIQDRRTDLFPNAQKILAVNCLTYLLLEELQEALPHSADQVSDLEERFPFLEYAAENWGDHARDAFDDEVETLSAKFLGSEMAIHLWSLVSTGRSRLSHEDYDIAARKTTGNIRQIHVAARFGLLPFVERSLLVDGINARDHHGATPFMWAARFGHLSVVKLLHSREDLDKNTQNDAKHTALGMAVAESRLGIVEYLLQDPEVDVNLGSPLAVAISEPNETMALLLLSRSDVDVNAKLDGSNKRLFWDAVIQALIQVVTTLLGRKDLDPLIDPEYFGAICHPIVSVVTIWIEDWDIMNEQEMINSMLIIDRLIADDRIGPTMPEVTRILWYWRIFKETFTMKHLTVISWIHHRGIEANYADSRGETFLHQAVTEDIESVQRLLDLGAKPDSADITGWSALHEAVTEEGRTSIIELLLDHGAKPDAQTHSRWSVLHSAVSAGQMDYVSLLIDRGADINCRSKLGSSPLDVAVVEASTPGIILLLLEKGADPHGQSSDGYTALHWAAENPLDFACRLLLRKGVKVDAVTFGGYGATPLIIAARRRSVGVVRALVEAGADPTIIGSFGRSALDLAVNTPALWDAMSRHWTDNYSPTPESVQQSRLKDCIGFFINFILSLEQDQRSFFYLGLSCQLLLDGEEEGALTGLRSCISTLRYPIGKREFSPPCDACKSNAMPVYFCMVCTNMQLCQECMKGYPKKDMPWCRGHKYLELDKPGWADVEKGLIESGMTSEQWLRHQQEKYPFTRGSTEISVQGSCY